MSQGHQHTVRGENVVLDIGRDVGALVIYTTDKLSGHEIEITRRGADTPITHTEVHPRNLASGIVHAAVFGALEAGDYSLSAPGALNPMAVRIEGGEVAELDWR